MASTSEIAQQMIDTVNNLVERYKALSLNESTTYDELKDIDKELGDCFGLLSTIDNGLFNLATNDLETLITNGTSLIETLDIKSTSLTQLTLDIQTKLDNGDFQGEQGIQGVKGEQGIQGLKGDKGDTGAPLTFEDLTPEQIDLLKAVNPEDFYTKEDIITLLQSFASSSDLSLKADSSTVNQILDILNSDNLSLDTFQEVVNYITANRDALDTLSLDNLADGTMYKKLTVELFNKLSSLRSNSDIDTILLTKANATGSTEKTFNVADAQQDNEAINLGQANALDSALLQQVQDLINQSTSSVIPVGMGLPYHGNDVPDGFLLENGDEVSRTEYADLFAVIGTTHGEGDGSTTFNLPDSRGVVYRGLDEGRGVDSNRELGTYQEDSFQGHKIEVRGRTNGGSADISEINGGISNFSCSGGLPSVSGVYNVADTIVSDGINGDPRVSYETRMKNIAVRFMIKY